MAKNIFNTGYISRDGGIYGMVDIQTDEFISPADVSNPEHKTEIIIGKNTINFTASIFQNSDKPPLSPEPAPTLMAIEYANILYEGQAHLKEINFSGRINDKVVYGIKGQFVGTPSITITDVILSNLRAAVATRTSVRALSPVFVTPGGAGTIAATVDPNVINNQIIAGLSASAIAQAAIGQVVNNLNLVPDAATAIASSVDPAVLNPVILTNIIASAIVRADSTALTPVLIGNLVADVVTAIAEPTVINPVILSNLIASAITEAGTTALTPVVLSGLLANVVARAIDPTIGQPVLISDLVASVIAAVTDPNVVNPVILSDLTAAAIAKTVNPTAIEGDIAITPPAASTITRTIDPPEFHNFIRTTGDNSHFSTGTGDWGGIALEWASSVFRAQHDGQVGWDFYLEFIGTAEGLPQGKRFQLDFDYWNANNIWWLLEIWSDPQTQTQTLAGNKLTGDGSIQYIGEIPVTWAHQLFLRLANLAGIDPEIQIDNVICKEILL